MRLLLRPLDAATVAAASGAGAAENATVEGSGAHNCQRRAPQPAVCTRTSTAARAALHLPARKHPSQAPAIKSCCLRRYALDVLGCERAFAIAALSTNVTNILSDKLNLN